MDSSGILESACVRVYLCFLIWWGSPGVGQVPVAMECLPQDRVVRLLGYSPLRTCAHYTVTTSTVMVYNTSLVSFPAPRF